jgi:hypothetical protein
MRSRVRG